MPETNEPYVGAAQREAVERTIASLDDLMHGVAAGHAPEFLEIGVTMPQAKVLYLVVMAGGLRMSELAARLGVSLSTVSGLVERLVEGDLVARHDDPADRRQVVVTATPAGIALLDRFNELNAGHLRRLLASLDDEDLAVVERAFRLLAGVMAARPTPPALDVATERKPA